MERNPQPRRLFLFPLPFQGHISPMFQLASLLHHRGFSITIFHPSLNYPDTTRHPDFHFIPIPDGLDNSIAPAVDVLARVKDLNTNCVAPFREQAARMLAEDPIAAVVVDALFYSVREAAEEMGLRTVVLRTGSAACCNVFFALPLLWEKGYLPIRALRTLKSTSGLILLFSMLDKRPPLHNLDFDDLVVVKILWHFLCAKDLLSTCRYSSKP